MLRRSAAFLASTLRWYAVPFRAAAVLLAPRIATVAWLSAVLFVLALIDYAYQRYRHERDLKMTKEEVKDELRSMEQIVAEAEDTIAVAYSDAAAALLAAELIDEAYLDDVAGVIGSVGVVVD